MFKDKHDVSQTQANHRFNCSQLWYIYHTLEHKTVIRFHKKTIPSRNDDQLARIKPHCRLLYRNFRNFSFVSDEQHWMKTIVFIRAMFQLLQTMSQKRRMTIIYLSHWLYRQMVSQSHSSGNVAWQLEKREFLRKPLNTVIPWMSITCIGLISLHHITLVSSSS